MVGHLTAIARKNASQPTKWLNLRGHIKGTVLDYGCGRGADSRYLTESGFDVTSYDPYWNPIEVNGTFETVICNYVLNVVEPEEMTQVLANLTKFSSGTVFVAVRRDLPREGAKGKGCTQRWVECPEGFEVVTENRTFAIFKKEI